MALTVVGIFDDASEAQQAVEALVNDGFGRGSIDISAGRPGEGDVTTSIIPDRHENTSGTRTEEVTDAAKDTGSSIGNFFSSLFGDDEDDSRTRYSSVAAQASVVTVHTTTEEEAERAADILDDSGAIDVNERSATYGYADSRNLGVVDEPLAGTVSGTEPGLENQTINVIEEDLAVGKRTVETGGVRVRSRIVAKPVEESIRLREERVTVNRTPVSRVATAADLTAFQDGQIELTEHAEVPVVSKTVNVVEEISVGKAVTEREEVIRDTVRKTEVDVEDLGTTNVTALPGQADSTQTIYPEK